MDELSPEEKRAREKERLKAERAKARKAKSAARKLRRVAEKLSEKDIQKRHRKQRLFQC